MNKQKEEERMVVPVALGAHHTAEREGYRAMLEGSGRYRVHWMHTDGRELVAALETGAEPGLLLVDLELPGMDGLAVLGWMAQAGPPVPVVVVTDATDDATALATYRAGAAAMLHKGAGRAEHLAALEVVLAGGVYHSPASHSALLRNPEGYTPEELRVRKLLAGLTPRCRQVLERICQPDDPTYQVIAGELGIGQRTVETYVQQLFELFGVRSKAALAVSAVRLGLVGGRRK